MVGSRGCERGTGRRRFAENVAMAAGRRAPARQGRPPNRHPQATPPIQPWLTHPPKATHQYTSHLPSPTGKYFPALGSILPVGDVTAAVPPEDADVAILEEPEHVSRGRTAGARDLRSSV